MPPPPTVPNLYLPMYPHNSNESRAQVSDMILSVVCFHHQFGFDQLFNIKKSGATDRLTAELSSVSSERARVKVKSQEGTNRLISLCFYPSFTWILRQSGLDSNINRDIINKFLLIFQVPYTILHQHFI